MQMKLIATQVMGIKVVLLGALLLLLAACDPSFVSRVGLDSDSDYRYHLACANVGDLITTVHNRSYTTKPACENKSHDLRREGYTCTTNCLRSSSGSGSSTY